MRFFISSTFDDLKEYRRYAIEYLRHLVSEKTGQVIAMEFFPASEQNSFDVCMAELEKADFVIGIYGSRFGWEPDETGRSITEIEFDRATELNKPILKFVSYQEKEVKQEKFVRSKILVPGPNCGRFTCLEDFAEVLHSSVLEYFKDFEGYSYRSIWGDIKELSEYVKDLVAHNSLRMLPYVEGDETSAINQIIESSRFLEELQPLINQMYYFCSDMYQTESLPDGAVEELRRKWEDFFIGIPNHLSFIRLAAYFLKVSYLRNRLLTEVWTDTLREEILKAKEEYIAIAEVSHHID